MNHIGTLSEKSIHAQLKQLFQPDPQYHEVKIGRYIADVCVDKKIVEIQTGQLFKLEKKLNFYLENEYQVTVVYPIPQVNTLHWCDTEGEIVSSRKTTKKKSLYHIIPELMGITQFVGHPNLVIKVLCLQCQEIRILDGYGKDKKNRATKYAKIMDCILTETVISNPNDVKNLLPKELGRFTAKEFAKHLGLKSRKIYQGIHSLETLGLIEKTGKEKRAGVWSVV